MTVRTVACTCGAIQLDLSGEPRSVNACCCTSCQRATGSVMSWSAFFPSEAAVLRGASSTYRIVLDSGGTLLRHFCPVCATVLFHEMPEMPGTRIVFAGLLAGQGAPAPENLFFTRSRPHWLPLPEGVSLHRTR